MKNTWVYILSTITLLTGYPNTAPANELTLNAVIASVNGKPITLSDLEARTKSKKNITISEVSSDPDLRNLLDTIINEHLIEEEARQRQLTVNQNDIDSYINEIASQNSLSLDEFKVALNKEQIKFDDYKNKVRFEILKNRIASVVFREGVTIDDEEIDAYIKQHPELTKGGDKIKLRQLYIDKSSRKESELSKLVDEVESKINQENDFAAIAKTYSESPDAKEGGLIGLVAISDLNPLIQDAVLLLSAGETSEAITTEKGIYYFHVEEKLTGDQVALKEDVRRLLENQRLQQKLSRYFALDIFDKHSVDKKV